MKKLLGIVFLSLLLNGNTYADTIYNGTLIDAHSQVGKLISNETVSKIINQNDIDFNIGIEGNFMQSKSITDEIFKHLNDNENMEQIKNNLTHL